MAHDVAIILDDRVPPPPEIVAAIGDIPFRRILRRRRRLAEEIAAIARAAGRPLHVIDSDEAAHTLALRIETRVRGRSTCACRPALRRSGWRRLVR